MPGSSAPSTADPEWRWSERVTFVDVFISVALAFVGVPMALLGSGSVGISLLLDLALVPPLILRRREPLVAFWVIVAVVFSQWLIDSPREINNRGFAGYHLVGDIALLVAFYNVAAREPRRRMLVAAAGLEVALLLATLRIAGGGSGPALFVLLSGTAAAAAATGANTRTRRAYLASVEDRAASVEVEREQQAQLVAAAERARIAREMHDVVAHNLSVMIALADGASFAASTSAEEATDAMRQVATTGRQALGEMRRLLGVLRDGDGPTATAPQPGLVDLDALLTHVRMTGLSATLVTEGDTSALTPSVQLAAYRLVQESLTNTLKHAVNPQMVWVHVRVGDGTLMVDVVDDGSPPVGTGWASAASSAGQGIAGMQERVSMYGGVVSAGPEPGFGWHVHASMDVRTR